MRFEITKEFAFEAAHHLPQMEDGHQCKRPHGHSYRVRVTLTGTALTDAGFIEDFGKFGASVKQYINSMLDHRDLALVFGGENTTAERLAVILYFVFLDFIPDLVAVTVCETAGTTATFRFDPVAALSDGARARERAFALAGIVE